MAQTTTQQPLKETDPVLAQFERFEQEAAGQTPHWVYPIRKAGLARFAEMGFPTLKHEDWRFTNLKPLMELPFQPVFQPQPEGITAPDLEQLHFGRLPGHRLVFINGHYAEDLSSVQKLPQGVQVSNLSRVLAEDGVPIKNHLAQYANGDNNAFAALNTAFFQDGAVVHVPKGKVIEEPIHLVFVSTGPETGSTAHPRNLIVAGAQSQVTVLESHIGLAQEPYFTNAVNEFVVGEAAVVEHCKFQDDPLNAFHMATLYAHLSKDCRFNSHSIALGGRISRNNIRTKLDGEGVECLLNGLFLGKDEQVLDHHMIVEHAQPHSNSHEYFNGILDGRSKGVFHGRILVQQAAQKTDAKQTNKNILLSDEATIDTKPQLEIYADDVKCTHGATIGQLNNEAIYYLQTRGLSRETARRMLIHAFAGEILDRVQCTPVREELDAIIWDRLEQSPQLAEQP